MKKTDKFTKIIATLGPATDKKEDIQKLYEAGMNVCRLNFSHGSYDYFEDLIKKIRSVSDEIAILLDTKGPEIRTGEVDGNSLILKDGQEILFTNKIVPCTETEICINYKNLDKLKKTDRVLIDDGLIEAEITGKFKGSLKAKILNGGVLGSRKTVSIKGHNVQIPFMSKKDKEDILFGIKHNVDFIAASFVRKKDDVLEIRKLLDRKKSKAMIISKIEHWEAVTNIEDIVEASDGIMVARGDLGVEVSLEKVPRIQIRLIRHCNEVGKPVIVATQMLESMKDNPRPTRAEVADIAQAILQGADAIMLSGETAAGKYPVQSVRMMTKIAKEFDKRVVNKISAGLMRKEDPDINPVALYITRAAFHASKALKTSAILAPTESGYTARKVSRFRPQCPILAITRDMTVLRQLQISWGVFPMIEKKRFTHIDQMINDLVKKSFEKGLVDKEDMITIIAGYKLSKGHTNLLEIYRVKEVLDRM